MCIQRNKEIHLSFSINKLCMYSLQYSKRWHILYIITNNTAAFTEQCLLWWYQYKCNWLFSLCLNANTGAVQILCSIIDIEKTESDCAVTWKRKKGKDNLVPWVFALCQPRAALLRVKCNVSEAFKNILELCLHFLLHRPEPVPQSGSWAHKYPQQECHLTNEAAVSCRDGTRGEF